METLQPSLLVPACGGHAAENKATLHYLGIRQESHLRAILVGLQLFYTFSMKVSIEHLGHGVGGIVAVLLYPIPSC